MNQSDKMNVINEAFQRAESREDLKPLVEEWRAWFDGLGWYEHAVSPNALAEAERRFRALQVAHGTREEMPMPPLPTLGKGTRGAAVRRLKQALGLTPVDGNFDVATEAALK